MTPSASTAAWISRDSSSRRRTSRNPLSANRWTWHPSMPITCSSPPSPCARGAGCCGARAGCWARRSMTGGGAAGDIWFWVNADCGWSMRSVGWTCPDCGVRTEELPWAGPGARHTRDFEDMVLWLAQRTDRTSVATLMRCGWETVTAIINRGVAELLDARRLQALYRIGVDEVCYRHPHRYLPIVGDHDTGTAIESQPGRSDQSLPNFDER